MNIEELLCKLLFVELDSMGIFKEKGAGICDKYDRWLEVSLGFLKEKGFIVDGPASIDKEGAWKEWEREKINWAGDRGKNVQAVLAETTLRALPSILKGEVAATDIIFPDSSMDLVGGIYKNNKTADYFNGLIAGGVTGYLKEWLGKNPSKRVKIMEIGAGTGGTSAFVFEKLKDYRGNMEEYCYTDLSRAFLIHGEKEYGEGNPYLTFKIFNAEKPISGQGFKVGSFDIVIASNVLHATGNIRETLRNSKALLRKNGAILLNEINGRSVFTHVTFGLLEGWWLYEDGEIRIPGSPGLYPESWKKVLEEEGFREVKLISGGADQPGQQIIMAVSDGVVRQKFSHGMDSVRAKEPARVPQVVENPGDITHEALREKSKLYFRKLVAETLKIPVSEIETSEPLEKYGLDSILVVQLNNNLKKVLDNISSTLFFEYQNIDALVEHFLATRKDSIIKLIEKDGIPEPVIHGIPGIAASNTAPRKSRRFINVNRPGPGPDRDEPIAIIGISGRYPGARNLNDYWKNLKEGKNCIVEIPKDRWGLEGFYNPDKQEAIDQGKSYSKWGGFIDGVDEFDPLFFNISPREAEIMNPQERLFLEAVYSGIEDAGYKPSALCDSNKVGVFVGVMNDYYPSGPSYWSIANRVSYFFNYQGPSLAVDTACSSSLTAIHLAVENLQRGKIEYAIAGGVNLITAPYQYLRLTSVSMLSSGNRCRTFGDQADGFVPGEGVGAVLLKPLRNAVEDGDHIYGVIRGSNLNAGGKTNGYTVPNPSAQAELIRETIEETGINARSISYIEAHGTGTSLGDPIEIAGLTRAFRYFTQDKQFCSIGSVKSNIGHCESAAGISAITKVILQMKHRQLVPSLNSEEKNPNINFSDTPFIVQQELSEWKSGYPRIAGISSFGAGGSNAHIIIEEYEREKREQSAAKGNNPMIIVLSARNEERLREKVKDLLAFLELEKYGDDRLAEIAYTLQAGREGMEERLGFTAANIKELKEKMSGYAGGAGVQTGLYLGQVKRNKEALSVFNADEDLQKAMESWIIKGKYEKLIDLWVKGLNFDWNKLYNGKRPLRISLPGYPFAREKYWISGKPGNQKYKGVAAFIHPLLHENTSDLREVE